MIYQIAEKDFYLVKHHPQPPRFLIDDGKEGM